MNKYTGWHKALASGSGENCVEQAANIETGGAGVRDTKQKSSGPVIDFSATAWTAFIDGVSTNEKLDATS
jgi:hypothetical protein